MDTVAGVFVEHFLFGALKFFVMIQRLFVVSLELICSRIKLVRVIHVRFRIGLFGYGEGIAEYIQRFCLFFLSNVHPGNVQHAGALCASLPDGLSNGETLGVKRQSQLVVAHLHIDRSDVVQRPRFAHGVVDLPEQRQAPVEIVKRVLVSLHLVESPSDPIEGSRLEPSLRQAVHLLDTFFVLLESLFEIVDLLIEEPQRVVTVGRPVTVSGFLEEFQRFI